ncbi:hypothetical protein WN944_029350 [Citrus x changshan-huyou]|uniref:Uncharacterized protein n=1 Tax=Citrus x changshan-huyou TaxID=2935761 RepID=A0AAP0LSD2_9ROSI
MQLLETGVENDLVLSLVVFSLQYLLVNHEYWKYKSAVTLPGDFDLEDRQYLPCRLLNARATAGFNSHLLATSVYANMLKVLQVIKTCIISTLVPGKLGEKLYVIRTFELMEIEGLELAIGSALDILYTMLSKFSKEISSIPSVFHQAVLSPTTTPVPVFAAVTSLISYFRNPAVQVGATKVLSLLLTISDYSQPYFSGNACFGFDDNQIADLRHSVESSLQSGEHEDLFVASVNLLTSAAHYQPAFLIAFFSTTESEDVPQSNDSGMNRSANEASSGLLGSKKSGVINAILLYIERLMILSRGILWTKQSPRTAECTPLPKGLVARGWLQSPVLEGITEVESHNLAYKYQWANTNLQPAENGEYRFTGTQIRGIKVPHSTTLEQLVKKVVEVISIDLSEFIISMKFKFKILSEPLPPMEILNDCDVEFFLEKANSAFRNPLCITYERRVNIIEPNGDIRGENSLPKRHISWEEGHYYPTVDLSASQPEVDRVRIEYDSFIPHPTEVHLDVEDIMVPDIEARTVHLDAEDMTLPNIKARTDSPLVLTIIQPRCSNNYLVRLGLLASRNSISTNDSFLSVNNLASNEVGNDSDGFMERQLFSSKEQQYGYDISYHKAWRARECAMQIVRGSPEESYKLLLQYIAMFEKKNLRTRTFLEVDDTNHFKYFSMAIGSSLRRFSSSIRPVIAVDGTFVNGKYKGTMFIATCKDGNNQIYPLAFGVGDSENDASWF